MIKDNFKRFDIWCSMPDRYDINLFNTKCIEQNADVMSMLEFAQNIGVIHFAEKIYPNIPLIDAYVLLLHGNNVTPSIESSCKTCGGGEIR